MSDITDGGPAFPAEQPVETENYEAKPISTGMTLRDYFAAKALATVAGYAADDVATWDADHFAAHAYNIADAMLRAREVQS